MGQFSYRHKDKDNSEKMKAVFSFSLHSKGLPAFPCLQGAVVYRKTDSVPNGHPIVAEVGTESHPSGGAGVSSLQGAALKSRLRQEEY